MKTTARFLLSAITALGLTAFTVISAFTASLPASATGVSFGLLVIYTLLELAALSYGTRPAVRRRSVLRPVTNASPRRMPTFVRVPAVVEYAGRRVHAA